MLGTRETRPFRNFTTPPPPPPKKKPLPQDGAWLYPDTAKANSLTGGADGKGDWKPRVTGAHRSALIALMRNRRGGLFAGRTTDVLLSKVTSRTGSTCWVPFVDLMDLAG